MNKERISTCEVYFYLSKVFSFWKARKRGDFFFFFFEYLDNCVIQWKQARRRLIFQFAVILTYLEKQMPLQVSYFYEASKVPRAFSGQICLSCFNLFFC